MHLNRLLDVLPVKSVIGSTEHTIRSIVHDSRRVKPGDVFVAIREPTGHDGHQYIDAAIDQGAVAVISEKTQKNLPITTIEVPDTHIAFSLVAANFFDFPASQLKMIGVTGTNGKTTVTFMIDAILRAAGMRCGIIGTTGSRHMDRPVAGAKSHTTPYPMQLHEALRTFVGENAEYAVMEVSSHGLVSDRLASVKFDLAVFTNLTRDHLDDHKTIEGYREAKMKLFSSHLDDSGCAVINKDDPSYGYFLDVSAAKVLTYALNSSADISRVGPVQCFSDRTVFNVEAYIGSTFPVSIPLPGRYNASNALAAMGVALSLDVPVDAILQGLKNVRVPGRLERIDCGQPFTVLVDFAHTSDALDSVLSACREWTVGALIVVFGCGGDRDRGKRPMMAKAACNHADYVILTTDNPRMEATDIIFRDTESGLASHVAAVTIEDREEAIDHAIKYARPDDTVLIAGKGDEAFQIINDTYLEFDDRLVARQRIEAHYG